MGGLQFVNTGHVNPGRAPANLLPAAHKSGRPAAERAQSGLGRRSKLAVNGPDRGDMGV